MAQCLQKANGWVFLALLLLLSNIGRWVPSLWHGHSSKTAIAEDAPMEVHTLQLPDSGKEDSASLSSKLSRFSKEQRLEAARPFSWVHVPKTGASIMNAVFHLPGICPTLAQRPEDYLCSSVNPDCQAHSFAEAHGGWRQNKTFILPKVCPGIARYCHHGGFSTEYLSGHQGHGLIMLRQPEQRLLSGYYNTNDHHGWHPTWDKPRSVKHYAEVVQGVSVKMLTRDNGNFNHLWFGGPPSKEETQLAVKRLRDGFAFIGIFEEYELSVCLLHAMFGNECTAPEFFHGHPSGAKWWRSQANASAHYNLEELHGFRDVYDRAVFEEAMRIFRVNLRLYNVSKESCMPCFLRAGVSRKQMAEIGDFNRRWDPVYNSSRRRPRAS